MGLLARDQGVADDNLSDRAFTVANDVYTVERFFAEVESNDAEDSFERSNRLESSKYR